jgi:hypothetical protein
MLKDEIDKKKTKFIIESKLKKNYKAQFLFKLILNDEIEK